MGTSAEKHSPKRISDDTSVHDKTQTPMSYNLDKTKKSGKSWKNEQQPQPHNN